jgi:hypothetical protein
MVSFVGRRRVIAIEKSNVQMSCNAADLVPCAAEESHDNN